MNSFWKSRCLPLMAALAFTVTAAPAAHAQNQDIGRQMEREYGVVGPDTREGRILTDQLDEVVSRIVRGVNQQRNRSNFRLRSATILGGRDEKHNRVLNAFALPDGRIYVTLGLMRAVNSGRQPDDELAFVVGHEVTHVAEKHSQGQSQKAILAGVGSMLLGAVTKSNAVGQIGSLGASAYVSHYGRKDEYNADRGGLMAMHEAGYNPNAAIDMLGRLRASGEESNRLVNGWFGSHPLTGNRIEKIREMIRSLEAGRDIDREGESNSSRGRRR